MFNNILNTFRNAAQSGEVGVGGLFDRIANTYGQATGRAVGALGQATEAAGGVVNQVGGAAGGIPVVGGLAKGAIQSYGGSMQQLGELEQGRNPYQGMPAGKVVGNVAMLGLNAAAPFLGEVTGPIEGALGAGEGASLGARAAGSAVANAPIGAAFGTAGALQQGATSPGQIAQNAALGGVLGGAGGAAAPLAGGLFDTLKNANVKTLTPDILASERGGIQPFQDGEKVQGTQEQIDQHTANVANNTGAPAAASFTINPEGPDTQYAFHNLQDPEGLQKQLAQKGVTITSIDPNGSLVVHDPDNVNKSVISQTIKDNYLQPPTVTKGDVSIQEGINATNQSTVQPNAESPQSPVPNGGAKDSGSVQDTSVPAKPDNTAGSAQSQVLSPADGAKEALTGTPVKGSLQPVSTRLQQSVNKGVLDFNTDKNVGKVQQFVSRILKRDAPDVNIKGTAREINQAYSSVRGGQEIAGQQIEAALRKLAPEVTDRQAITLAQEFGGNANKLAEYLDKKGLESEQPAIQRAIEISNGTADKNLIEAARINDDYYRQTGQAMQDSGKIKELNENYNNRMYYKNEAEQASGDTASKFSAATRHSMERTYDNPLDAILDEKVPELDAAELQHGYNQDFSRVLPNHLAEKGIIDSGLGQRVKPGAIPENMTAVQGTEKDIPIRDENGQAVIGKDGNQVFNHSVLAVDSKLANYIRPLTDPNFFQKIDLLKQGASINAVTKAGKLSLSLYHWSNEAKVLASQMMARGGLDLPQLAKTMKNPDMLAMQRFAADNGVIVQSSTDSLEGVFKSLREAGGVKGTIANLPLIKQAGYVSDAAEHALFGRMIPYLKTIDFNTKGQDWIAKHPNATQLETNKALGSLAREINSAYGGINWTALGKSPSMVSVGKFAALAYDWTYSNYDIIKQVVEVPARGITPGAKVAAGAVAAGYVMGHLSGDAINTIMTGHPMSGNPKGHQSEVSIGNNLYWSPFPAGVSDPLKLISDIQSKGPILGTGQFLSGKASPLASVAIGLLTNDAGGGNTITSKGASIGQNTLNALGFAGSRLGPYPIGVGGAIQAAQGGANPLQVGLAASGLAKYEPPLSNNPANSPYEQGYQKAVANLTSGSSSSNPLAGGSTSASGNPLATTGSSGSSSTSKAASALKSAQARGKRAALRSGGKFKARKVSSSHGGGRSSAKRVSISRSGGKHGANA